MLVGGLVLLAFAAVYLGWSSRPIVDAGRSPSAAVTTPSTTIETTRSDRPDRSTQRPAAPTTSATSATPDEPRTPRTSPTRAHKTPDERSDDRQPKRAPTPQQSTRAKLERSPNSAGESTASTPTSTSSSSPTHTPEVCKTPDSLEDLLRRLTCPTGKD
ncbi:MAG: hypothetical protein GEV07_17645 [Streptosporangiales bacterium]|nr:hypothetical protein [Streptosporangiales bacterium]